LARGAVAQGLLVNKPAKAYLNYSPQQIEQAAAAIQAVSSDQRNAAQTAIRFVLQHPAVTAAVAGIRTMQQLEEAVSAIKSPSITDEQMTLLQRSVDANQYEQHR
jgi:aryl-alcohol dehydrogenase-like predicted oxidoreductase